MHDTILPMAFNSRPKVTFSDTKGRDDDSDKGEVEFTFGKSEEEDKTEDGSEQKSEMWPPPMPDNSSTTLGTATKAGKGE